MTERKPPGVSFESWVEKQIREAADRGEFDNLPGAGKPLPGLHGPREEQWWLKTYLRREGLSAEAVLPTPLQLRKEIERIPGTVRELCTEQAVREVVEKLNARIVDWLRAPSGPQVQVGLVNAQDVVEQWRADQVAVQKTAPVQAGEATTEKTPSAVRARWWRRIARRRRAAETPADTPGPSVS